MTTGTTPLTAPRPTAPAAPGAAPSTTAQAPGAAPPAAAAFKGMMYESKDPNFAALKQWSAAQGGGAGEGAAPAKVDPKSINLPMFNELSIKELRKRLEFVKANRPDSPEAQFLSKNQATLENALKSGSKDEQANALAGLWATTLSTFGQTAVPSELKNIAPAWAASIGKSLLDDPNAKLTNRDELQAAVTGQAGQAILNSSYGMDAVKYIKEMVAKSKLSFAVTPTPPPPAKPQTTPTAPGAAPGAPGATPAPAGAPGAAPPGSQTYGGVTLPVSPRVEMGA